MKRVISLILVLLLTAALAGCGASGSKDVDVSALAAELAQKVEFSAPLKELTAEQLGNYLTLPEGTRAAAYMTSGLTMEEVFAFRCGSAGDAAAVKTAVEALIASQIDSVRPYQPEAVPRLESAVLVQKDVYVVLCVTDDTDTAERIIKEQLG
jgi:predicted small lipoprotein YifL